ncbi:PAS domain-containing sensor histidine kinase [Catalinimonas niigatensis]|uniref:PAS domain-containing sensor histidine kinase n=1 Tax=Catalinimonas niigatensis TaxID=1397264 RepID=UPI00266584F2|nr:ATP-binding protein [Catalinimonas niigatensis]WPP51490.1 ATP-binding protein [Catalinimonas niigatensis]
MNDTFSYSPSLVETIMDNADDGIILFSPLHNEQQEIVDLKYVFANKTAERVVGKKREELLQTTLMQAFPQYNYRDLFNAYKQVLISGEPYKEEQYYNEEGLQRWFKISAKKIDSILLVNFSDISGFKTLIAEKSRSESLYRTLIRSLPHADVALVDLELNLLLVEGFPFRSLGYDKPIEEDSSLTDELSHEAKSIILPLLKSSLEGKVKKLERESEGSLFRVHILPVKDEQGEVFAALIVSEDIGIFNFSKEELRNKIYELENSNQSLEQFAYVASHDLQEPLRKIRAFGDRLQSKYSQVIDESGRDYIMRMQNAASRMQKLIDDLLKYSRVGRFQEPFQEVDLQKVVNSVLEDLEGRMEESESDVVIENLPVIEGDSGSLEQLFLNLLSNAIKFRKPESAPHIRIWAEEQVNNTQEDENIVKYNIFVKDDGIGFDEKYLDRIFNIFQRLHGRNEYAGTGIGLAICRKIVDMHSGTIYANSKPGEGATFVVTLPRVQERIV